MVQRGVGGHPGCLTRGGVSIPTTAIPTATIPTAAIPTTAIPTAVYGSATPAYSAVE
jgi:hypothetical protein